MKRKALEMITGRQVNSNSKNLFILEISYSLYA